MTHSRSLGTEPVETVTQGSDDEVGPAGVGGDFPWTGVADRPWLSWPRESAFYSTGRVALLQAVRNWRRFSRGGALHVPSYFCPAVTEYLLRAGVGVSTYEDSPIQTDPEWSTIACKDGDIVLAVNYFGVREGHHWREWRTAQSKVGLIEDHTHDPFSPWAQESSADYAFASVRKLYPIPDGGILWSPAGHSGFHEERGNLTLGATLKWAAMHIQAHAMLRSGRYRYLKWSYRCLQVSGERAFSLVHGKSMTHWSHTIIGQGVPQAWRDLRRENVTSFLQEPPIPGIKPLFRHWPEGACPFQVVLLFETQPIRDFVRSQLIQRRIYCPIHWTQSPGAAGHGFQLGSRILTIPADQRYRPEDMRRVVRILRSVAADLPGSALRAAGAGRQYDRRCGI
jgi:hypothetical protein